jgi:hypothetical protein
MNLIEDRLRAAAQAAADTIPAGSAPPLRLSQASQRRTPDTSPQRPRWSRLVAPLAAAAAVMAVIATSVAIAGGGHPQRPSSASVPLLDQVPRYYLALTTSLNTGVVRDTVTGATVASIHAPGSLRFYEVFAAANDRTFVLIAGPQGQAAGSAGRLSFFVARLNPARRAVTLSLLPDLGPAIPRSADMFALSPDGARLAVGLGVHSAQLRIYSLAGHVLKEWQEDHLGTLEYPFIWMSWGASTLVYGLDGSATNPTSFRTLNTNAASGSLLRASRLAVSGKHLLDLGFSWGSYPVVSGDGKTIVAGLMPGGNLPPGAVQPTEFAEYSAATGKLIRYLWPTAHDTESVLWSNFSGSVLVVLAPVHRYSPGAPQLGVLSGGRFVPIPHVPDGSWESLRIAF